MMYIKISMHIYGLTSYDIPEGSYWHVEGVKTGSHHSSAPHSRHLKVHNAQPFLSGTTCLCGMSFSSDTLHLAGSCLSGNPSSSCMNYVGISKRYLRYHLSIMFTIQLALMHVEQFDHLLVNGARDSYCRLSSIFAGLNSGR